MRDSATDAKVEVLCLQTRSFRIHTIRIRKNYGAPPLSREGLCREKLGKRNQSILNPSFVSVVAKILTIFFGYTAHFTTYVSQRLFC